SPTSFAPCVRCTNASFARCCSPLAGNSFAITRQPHRRRPRNTGADMERNTQQSGLFDWAVMDDTTPVRAGYTLFDETLRDGIQAPYVPNPPLEVKLGLVDLMVRAGVRAADLGFPGASAAARRDCIMLAKHVVRQNLPLQVAFAGRTAPAD